MFLKVVRKEQVVLLPINAIAPNPAQPRTVFEQAELDRLAESIEQNGILQPITVRALPDGGYELISGERRLRACQQLKMDRIKAIVIEVSDQQSAIFAMIENLQRQDLNFFDEARGIHELIYQWKVTQEEASVKLGIAQSTIANKLRLLRLTSEIQSLVIEKGLTERHARALLKLKMPEQQRQALGEIAQKKMNVAQTEQYIEELLAQKPEEQPQAPTKRILIVKDLRIFLRSIEKAVDTMKQAGIEAVASQSDESDYIEYRIKIPKASAYQQSREKDTILIQG